MAACGRLWKALLLRLLEQRCFSSSLVCHRAISLDDPNPVGTGIKPLSVYGLVHKFSKDRPVLATIEKAKPLTDAERDQIIQIMREHLLDCDDIPETRSGSSKENMPPISL